MISQYLFLSDERDKGERTLERVTDVCHHLHVPSSASGDEFGTSARLRLGRKIRVKFESPGIDLGIESLSPVTRIAPYTYSAKEHSQVFWSWRRGRRK